MSSTPVALPPVRRIVERVRKLVGFFTRSMAILAVLAIVFMVAATMVDVTSRGITGRPVPGVFELGEIMMVAIVFFSLGYAETKRAHISVTLLTSRLPKTVTRWLTSSALLLVIVVVGWMVLAAAERAQLSIATNEFRYGLVSIPIWPARVIVVIGLIGFLIELCLRLIDTACDWLSPDDEPVDAELAAAQAALTEAYDADTSATDLPSSDQPTKEF